MCLGRNMFFFFKQKTAYEMGISDWSSDVCSSDLEPGKGYEFVNDIVGGVIPKEFIPGVDKGLRDAIKSGVMAGYPVVDIKITLFDGSYHDVDSSEIAFRVASSMAFKDGCAKANPVILEPIMGVEVATPDE